MRANVIKNGNNNFMMIGLECVTDPGKLELVRREEVKKPRELLEKPGRRSQLEGLQDWFGGIEKLRLKVVNWSSKKVTLKKKGGRVVELDWSFIEKPKV